MKVLLKNHLTNIIKKKHSYQQTKHNKSICHLLCWFSYFIMLASPLKHKWKKRKAIIPGASTFNIKNEILLHLLPWQHHLTLIGLKY